MDLSPPVRPQYKARFGALLIALLILPEQNWPAGAAPSNSSPARINCSTPHQRTLDLNPVGPGPLVLARVYCQTIRPSALPSSAPIVSPDGRSIAYFEHDTILRVATLDGGSTWTDYQAELGSFARFSSDYRSVNAFSWASQGSFLWTATQAKVRPSGFGTNAIQPARTGNDGRLEYLPPLRHDAGPLDALLWVGGDGIAIAQFGTRGSYYRPEHDDPSPTFAIVDAVNGRVLDSLPFAAVDALRPLAKAGLAPAVLIKNATAVRLPDGRLQTMLNVGTWIVWTQGETPRTLANPYPGESNSQIAMAPDGQRILIGRQLRTEGGVCNRTGGCAPGRPVESVLAALHDLGTGHPVWTIRTRVTADYEFPAPSISDDGRYALVGLAPEGARAFIALIAMDDGHVVQTIPSPGGNYAMGFVRGGQTVWTHSHGLTALYDVRADAK